ncbi:MAG: PEP-CTERM sorting domain-containing protein [Sedimentisphaerales bacterium]|jgi:hypothetical protein
MKNVRMTICLIAAVLVMATSQGFGVTEFKDGGTHNISSTINDAVWVDYQAPGMQTTVNLLNGGNINSFEGFNDSRINIFGGTAGYSIYADDDCQATMFGGTVDYFVAENSSHITMSGGTVVKSLYAYGNSQLTFSGGIVENGYLFVYQNCQAEMSGGMVAGFLEVGDSATLIIDGSNFAIDGTPLSFGKITSILGGNYENETVRRLTGTLANGDIINNYFQIGNTASIVLIPEPATLLLLGLGAAMLRRKR